MRAKLAIACQGGGSLTAFAAGVLKQLLARDVHKTYDLTGLSGTSGGAICALLVWQSLLRQAHATQEMGGTVYDPLVAFWRDTTARLYWEEIWNTWIVGVQRLLRTGAIPDFKVNPYITSLSWMVDELMEVVPRREFLDFKRLLNKYIDFDELAALNDATSPRLLLGAVDVLSGKFCTFNSRHDPINADAVLASAAIPTLFKAVHINETAYWDGLISQNPPIRPFLSGTPASEKPDEIWIIQINPSSRKDIPESAPDILDRRTELAGNLSLYQEVRFICTVNRWLADEGFTQDYRDKKGYKPVMVRRIAMSDDLSRTLDYPSRMDRSQAFINRLIGHGEEQAEHFLHHLDEHLLDWV